MSTFTATAEAWGVSKWRRYGQQSGTYPTALIDVSKDHSASWHCWAQEHSGETYDRNTQTFLKPGPFAKEWMEIRSTEGPYYRNSPPRWIGWPKYARESTELKILDGTAQCDVATWPRWTATVTVADPGPGNRALVAPYGTIIGLEWRNNYAELDGPVVSNYNYYVNAPQMPGGPIVHSCSWLPYMQIVESTYNAMDGTYTLRCEDMTGIMSRMVWPRDDLTWADIRLLGDKDFPATQFFTLENMFSNVLMFATHGATTSGGDVGRLIGGDDWTRWNDNWKALNWDDPVPGDNLMQTLDAIAAMGGVDIALHSHSIIGDRAANLPNSPNDFWNMAGGNDPFDIWQYPDFRNRHLSFVEPIPEFDSFTADEVMYDISVTQNLVSWSRTQALRPNEWWDSYQVENNAGADKTRVGVARVDGGPSRWQKTGRVVVRNEVGNSAFTDANNWTRTVLDDIAKKNLRRARRRWIIDEIEAVPDPQLREGYRVKFRHASGEYRRGFVRGLRHDLTGANPMIVSIGSDLADETDTP